MSKPFKSQFDLMAEAYGNVNYNKQRIINEDTAGKTVIGYPPSEDYEDAEIEDAEIPSDEFFAMLDDVSMEVGSESYQAIVDGLEAKLGRKLTEREADEAHQMAQEDELPEIEAAEGAEETFAKIDQDVSNGVGKAELEGTYGAEVVAAYIADGEAKGKFEGKMEDAEDEPVAIVSMDTEEVGDCGSEDHADDSEMHMAQAELYKAVEYAGKLSELLNGIDSLEGWTASKITRASDYLSSVYHWLDYETNGKGRFNTGYEDAPEHPAEDNQ